MLRNNANEERILLFIPCYNCEKQIVRVLEQLDSNAQKYITETIIVNNRSTDDTEQVVLDFMKKNPLMPLTLLRNNENYGLGGSHKVAFNYAIDHSYEYVIVLHGDDQGVVGDLWPIISKDFHKEYDCCLGARFMKGAALPGYSRFRTFGNQMYNLLFSIVCGRRIYDLGSGLNMYSVKMLHNRYYLKYPDNLTFNYCMVMALQYYQQSALFFPITWREDDQISNVRLFSQAKKVLTLLVWYFFHREQFMKKELRDIPRDAYTAQIIGSTYGVHKNE